MEEEADDRALLHQTTVPQVGEAAESSDVEEDEDATEVMELKQLFADGQHGTAVFPRGMVLRFQVARDNQERAAKERAAKERRAKLLEESRQEQFRRAQALRAKRGEKDTEAVARLKAQNAEAAAKVRKAREEWKRQAQENKATLQANSRGVQSENKGGYSSVDARLDAQEELLNTQKRDEAQRAKAERKAQLDAAKARRMEKNQKTAAKVKKETKQGLKRAAGRRGQETFEKASGTRQAQADWQAEFQRNEAERLARANANRAHAAQIRANGRVVKQQKLEEKRKAVREEMANDVLAQQAKSQQLENNLKSHDKLYAHRYVRADEVPDMLQSDFRRRACHGVWLSQRTGGWRKRVGVGTTR